MRLRRLVFHVGHGGPTLLARANDGFTAGRITRCSPVRPAQTTFYDEFQMHTTDLDNTIADLRASPGGEGRPLTADGAEASAPTLDARLSQPPAAFKRISSTGLPPSTNTGRFPYDSPSMSADRADNSKIALTPGRNGAVRFDGAMLAELGIRQLSVRLPGKRGGVWVGGACVAAAEGPTTDLDDTISGSIFAALPEYPAPAVSRAGFGLRPVLAAEAVHVETEREETSPAVRAVFTGAVMAPAPAQSGPTGGLRDRWAHTDDRPPAPWLNCAGRVPAGS
jgi:hypothetical protein